MIARPVWRPGRSVRVGVGVGDDDDDDDGWMDASVWGAHRRFGWVVAAHPRARALECTPYQPNTSAVVDTAGGRTISLFSLVKMFFSF